MSLSKRKALKAKVKKAPNYNHVQQVLTKHREVIHEYATNALEQMLLNYLGSTLIVLRDQYGFGNQRIAKTMEAITKQVELITDKYVTADEMIYQIKKETGYDLYQAVAEMGGRRYGSAS